MSVEYSLLYQYPSEYKDLEFTVCVRRNGLPELVEIGLSRVAKSKTPGQVNDETVKIELYGRSILTKGRSNKKRGWISIQPMERKFNNCHYSVSDLGGLVEAINKKVLEARNDSRYPYNSS